MTFKTKRRQDIAWWCVTIIITAGAALVYYLLGGVHQNLGYVFALFVLKKTLDRFSDDILDAKIEWGNASLPRRRTASLPRLVKVAGSKTEYRWTEPNAKQCGHEETDEL